MPFDQIRALIHVVIHVELVGGTLQMSVAPSWLQPLCMWKLNGFGLPDGNICTEVNPKFNAHSEDYQKLVK